MNITVNSAKNTRGYLKVRAQAIDLRSESHGGIALQPKGTDGTFENKIKFEHGGGDGLEFGTFNTQHTSLYTNDYRFKKDGIIRLATRTTVASDKADPNDVTTALKYVKNQNDDFYDNIDVNDPTCTWEDIVTYIHWIKSTNPGPDHDLNVTETNGNENPTCVVNGNVAATAKWGQTVTVQVTDPKYDVGSVTVNGKNINVTYDGSSVYSAQFVMPFRDANIVITYVD
jgi:hypothetical protein